MTTTFSAHGTRAKLLATLIQRHLRVLTTLQMETEYKEMQPMVQSVLSDHFKVLVIGEFNRGKSTFINAMLGEKVLPAYPIETTAIINEIKWGVTKRARLYQQGKVTKDFELIKATDLEPYVKAVRDKENPYDKVELFWPLELCRDGVEIIDSPGLNVVSKTRRAQTLDYLPTADAIIMVIDATVAGAASEVALVHQFKDLGHTHIFFVCNKINLIDLEERALVERAFIDVFAPYTEPGAKYTFFLNAKGALNGRMHHDEQQMRESGILLIEDALKDFLVHERGRIKLLRPAQALRTSIQRAFSAMKDREAAFKETFESLQQKARLAERRLDSIEQDRYLIGANFERFIRDTCRIIEREAITFYRAQLEPIPTWASEYEIQEPLTLGEIVSNNKDARQRVLMEVQNGIAERMRQVFAIWERETLQPLITGKLESYGVQLQQQVRKFVEDFERIRADVFQGDEDAAEISAEQTDELLRQIIAKTTGYSGDVSQLDSQFGFGKMLTMLLPHGGLLGALMIVFGWHPFIFIPIVAVTAIINMIMHKDGINEKMKVEVGKQYKQQVELSLRDLADQIAETAEAQFTVMRTHLDHVLEQEIESFREQMKVSLADMQGGNVEQKLAEIRDARLELTKIDGELDGMIGQLALMRSAV